MTQDANWHVPQEHITAAARAIRASMRLVVLTGAGISKESGIPTFRDAQDGLWAQFDPTELATPRAFKRNPKRVWDWYQYRRELLAGAAPNPGHYAIAELEQLIDHVVVITQNIDGLHNKAGSTDVLPVHGDIRLNKCFANCQGNPTYVDIDALNWNPDDGPPQCPHCGAYVRPDVVWYEEMLPPALFDRATALTLATDLMLVVGTSGVTQPVASLPYYARERGATIVEVNPDRTPITFLAQWHLAGPSGAVLPRVIDAIKSSMADAAAGTESVDGT